MTSPVPIRSVQSKTARGAASPTSSEGAGEQRSAAAAFHAIDTG